MTAGEEKGGTRGLCVWRIELLRYEGQAGVFVRVFRSVCECNCDHTVNRLLWIELETFTPPLISIKIHSSWQDSLFQPLLCAGFFLVVGSRAEIWDPQRDMLACFHLFLTLQLISNLTSHLEQKRPLLFLTSYSNTLWAIVFLKTYTNTVMDTLQWVVYYSKWA